MSAIVKNMRSVWSAWSLSAEGCMKAIKDLSCEMAEGWAEAEAFWREHPETRPESLYYPM